MNSLLKSILKTAVYILDQTDNATADFRDRINDRAERVSDQVSEIASRGKEMIYGENHTWRNVGVFAAGLGVGVAAGMLFAPASGDEIRGSVREKVADISDRVRDRITPATTTRTRATGTETGV